MKNEIQTKIDGYTEELNTKQSVLDQATTSYNNKMEEVSQIDRSLQSLNDSILSLTVNLEKRAGETNVLRERLKFLKDEQATLTSELEKEKLNKDNSVKLIEVHKSNKEQKQKELNQVGYQLSDLTNRYLKVVDELTSCEDEATKKQKEMISTLFI